MSRPPAPSARPQRRVGLDRPCSLCGEAIYFNYRGPVEGICGRCSDRVKRKKRGTRRRSSAPATSRSRRQVATLLIVLALVAAAALCAHFLLR